MSKQIWDILYKKTVAPDIMQTEGGEEDTIEGDDPTDDGIRGRGDEGCSIL